MTDCQYGKIILDFFFLCVAARVSAHSRIRLHFHGKKHVQSGADHERLCNEQAVEWHGMWHERLFFCFICDCKSS